ncbi:MAG TPA: hypothetical protein VGS18_05370, partial [Thermoplasmata archaeon]|nr:hypothetical protein [Thermoplasmata archaeon]
LQIDLPEVIGTIARNLGRQMSSEIEGETPDEVARSLSEFYHRRAMGELEIVRARPLTLKVSQCFACVKQSPEIGRELCSSMLRSVFEARTGGTCEVSKPDPSRHAARGCLFSITPA